MNLVGAMVWKDIHSFLHDWRTLASVAILALALPCLLFFTGLASVLTVDAGLVAASVMVTVFLAYTLTWKSFSYERVENALASVLASPISVLELFLGKSLAVFLFGYPFLLAGAITVSCGLDVKMGAFPSISAFAMALLAIPVCGLAIAELMGALFLLMGNFEVVRYAGFALAAVMFDMAFFNQEAFSHLRVIAIFSLSGLATAVVIAVLFARVSKPRLAK